jgi:hypothetical protein
LFLEPLKEIWNYKFDEEPNYNKIRFLLAKIIIEKNGLGKEIIPGKDNIDWIKKATVVED